jgi:MEMO1 family protein
MIKSKPRVSNPVFSETALKGGILMGSVRKPVLSGSWYQADPGALAASVDDYIDKADMAQKPAGRPWLALTPHAGHVYSGPVAGRLFGLLRQDPPDNIFILAPNHRLPLKDIALPEESAFATPLGEVSLNTDLVRRLAREPGFSLNPTAHAQEHAIEIVLPFIQRTWPQAQPAIVPMLVPMTDGPTLKKAGKILASALGDNDLLLVSSDFTHYGSSFGFLPFTEDVPLSLERLDAGAILKILAGDATGLLDYGQKTGITMCGLAACCVALGDGPPTGYEAALLDYQRSADRDGDYSLSVSYAALLLTCGEDLG